MDHPLPEDSPASASATESYDEVPYPSLAHPDSYAERLATIAHLAGLGVPDPTSCRVLELGCGTGTNTVAMASTLPGSTFLAVDVSSEQVAAAKAFSAAVGTKNVSFEVRDILDVGPGDGQFDFVVAHGVYSWVPERVREHILDICRQNLAPEGVAYVSYNTYPGGHALQAMREMMAYHARNAPSPSDRAKLALELAAALDELVGPAEQPLAQIIHDYRQRLDFRDASTGGALVASLLHDDLAEWNEPVSFHQFVAAAERHGLQWLAEARNSRLGERRYPPAADERLGLAERSAVEAEQYLDFIEGRAFRRSLLVHAGREPHPELASLPDRLASVFVATDAEEDDEPEEEATGAVRFRTTGDEAGQLTTNHPIVVSAMRTLIAAAPGSVLFPRLVEAAFQDTYGRPPPSPAAAEADRRVVAEALIRGFCGVRGLVHLHLAPPKVTGRVSGLPVGYPLARALASGGSRLLPNVRGDRIKADPVAAFLLPLLNGKRTAAEIAEMLRRRSRTGRLAIEDESGNDLTERVVAEIPDSLRALARHGLLVA